MYNKTLLIAGHDLKFIKDIIPKLRELYKDVLIDNWSSHSIHNEQRSLELLSKADIVLCEWGLGNAVWYSNNIKNEQKLFVRIHCQEFQVSYLDNINHDNVFKYILINEHFKDYFIRKYSLKSDKVTWVDNYCKSSILKIAKNHGSVNKNVGIIGLVPMRKRVDLFFDIVESIIEVDNGYRFYIAGKLPWEFKWMDDRKEEMEYYSKQFHRYNSSRIKDYCFFLGFNDNVSEFYSKVDHVVSVSDFEGKQMTMIEAMSVGNFIYTTNHKENICDISKCFPGYHPTTKKLANEIIHNQKLPIDEVIKIRESNIHEAIEKYNIFVILDNIVKLLNS